MAKKIKKTRNKKIKLLRKIDILIGLAVIVSLSSLGAYKAYQKYFFKDCQEYELNNGDITEQRIKGTEELTGTYFNIPLSSCAQNTKKGLMTYENKGDYVEKKSCETKGKDKRTYIKTSYERCLFGCFNGECMDKCKDPDKDDIFKKGTSYGIDVAAITFSPLTATAENYSDYCTDKENTTPLTISKYVAKRTCDQNNYLGTATIKCEDICFDGACQKSDFRYCEDTDQDDQGKIPGLVSYYDPISKEANTKIDYCNNKKVVTEYFCGKDKLAHNLILTCRFDCANGQCLQK